MVSKASGSETRKEAGQGIMNAKSPKDVVKTVTADQVVVTPQNTKVSEARKADVPESGNKQNNNSRKNASNQSLNKQIIQPSKSDISEGSGSKKKNGKLVIDVHGRGLQAKPLDG